MPSKRALIVDDSTTAQYRLKKMLRPYDLHIDTADSGEAALRYLATNEPDVIFMDHLMPGMDGFRALQIIKSHPETAMIPVIMYTSKSGDVYTGQARALGALDVVSKDTITATELSNVMQAIHIYRGEKTTEASTTEASDENTAPVTTPGHPIAEPITPKFTEVGNQRIERRQRNQANAEQARNLELRLSHMEHTLEDSRKFITARVVRELQGLKQNIKEEFSGIIVHAQPDASPPPEPASSGWSILSKLIMLALLITIIFYLVKMSDALSQGHNQQQQFSEQLKALAAQQAKAQTAALATPVVQETVSAPKPLDNTYLADLAWTFNQTAALTFNQNNIDSKTVIRLYELLNRLMAKGFKGTVWLNIYVGNFCIAIDNFGQGQLANESANMGNCITSNELYGLDRVMEEYQNEVETTLKGLSQKPEKMLHIVMNTMAETDDYPERKPTLSAKSWNTVAQNHNRIELRLEPAKP